MKRTVSIIIFAFFLILMDLTIAFLFYQYQPQNGLDSENLEKNLLILTLVLLLITLFRKQLSDIVAKNIFAITLFTAGVLANFTERVIFGRVVDYISIQKLVNFNYPIFNLADIYLVIGSLWLVVIVLKAKSSIEN